MMSRRYRGAGSEGSSWKHPHFTGKDGTGLVGILPTEEEVCAQGTPSPADLIELLLGEIKKDKSDQGRDERDFNLPELETCTRR